MGLYVNDAEYFPQLTPMQIWIVGERMNGQFNGNFFSISERGAAIYTGTVTVARRGLPARSWTRR